MSIDTKTVVAALAVVVSVSATVFTLRANARTVTNQLASQDRLSRNQQLAEMTATALGYFTGGSQNRSVGIAGLRIVRNSTVWPQYCDAIRDLFQKQLIYLLAQGTNRWEAHEIANIE